MKTLRHLSSFFLLPSSLVALLATAGCFTHNLPRDAYLQGIHSKIVTPWGTHELVVDVGATGTAAKNVTLPEPPAPKPSAATVK